MSDISSRLSHDLQISGKVVEEHCKFFIDFIKPKIKTKFLSHLVTTVEDLINEKRMKEIIDSVKEKRNDIELIKSDIAILNEILNVCNISKDAHPAPLS